MAYTIQVKPLRADPDKAEELKAEVRQRLLRVIDKLGLKVGGVSGEYTRLRQGRGMYGTIEFRQIRLQEKRLYCGNHPGPCQVGPKRKARFLEGKDWIELHERVNDELDAFADKAVFNVWTLDPDSGKLWVRKNGKRRVRWDYLEVDTLTFVNPPRSWITGHGPGPEHRYQFDGPPSRVEHMLILQEGRGGKERPRKYYWPNDEVPSYA